MGHDCQRVRSQRRHDSTRHYSWVASASAVCIWLNFTGWMPSITFCGEPSPWMDYSLSYGGLWDPPPPHADCLLSIQAQRQAEHTKRQQNHWQFPLRFQPCTPHGSIAKLLCIVHCIGLLFNVINVVYTN